MRLAAWLHSAKKEYNEGLKIFKELNVNPEMTRFLTTTKPGKIQHSLLIRQLSEYARLHNIKPLPIPLFVTPKPVAKSDKKKESKTSSRVKVDKNPSVRYEDLPVQLQVLFDENGKLSSEMKTLHAQLKALRYASEKSGQRAELAKGLLARSKTLRNNWNQIDTWWNENKTRQDPATVAAQQAIEKDRRTKANLNYIRRYYNDSEKADEVKLRMAELDKWEVSYEELIRKISIAH